MDPRLIRFKRSPTTLRSYFVNDFLVKNLGKTKAQIEAAMKTWPERIDHPKHGRKTLAELLSTPGQDLKRFLNWTTGRDPGDFTFFSWNESGQFIFGPVNCETCLLVDSPMFLRKVRCWSGTRSASRGLQPRVAVGFCLRQPQGA